MAIVGFMISATGGILAEDQGLATGVANMSTQVGITLGTPIMAAVLAPSLLLGGAVNLVAGVHVAIAVNAGLCLLTAVLAAVFLGARDGKPAESGTSRGSTEEGLSSTEIVREGA